MINGGAARADKLSKKRLLEEIAGKVPMAQSYTTYRTVQALFFLP